MRVVRSSMSVAWLSVCFFIPLVNLNGQIGAGMVSSAEDSPAVMTTADVESALKRPCRFEFEDVPFHEVMGEVQEKFGINMILDQSALDDGLGEDEIVDFVLREAKLSTALRLLLKTKNATYLIDDGIINVISLDVAGDPEYFRRKVFSCDTLVATIQSKGSQIDSLITPQSGGGGRGGGGAARVTERVTGEQALINTIETTIDPDGWNCTNGDGSIAPIGGLLVVHQKEDVLLKIERLIEELKLHLKAEKKLD